jgi:hypothetical protein
VTADPEACPNLGTTCPDLFFGTMPIRLVAKLGADSFQKFKRQPTMVENGPTDFKPISQKFAQKNAGFHFWNPAVDSNKQIIRKQCGA